MLMLRRIVTFIISAVLLLGCGNHSEAESKKTIYVTITPLKSIVEEIVCGDYSVEVLVPKGASPESFEPTMNNLIALNSAEVIYSTGLINFEQTLIGSVKNNERIVNLSHGIELIEGSCSHGHHHHKHGIDPHIWTSPRALKQIVRNIDASLPADSSKYHTNADKLLDKLNDLDSLCSKSIELNSIDAIMIYHPAFTYYAHDYGIEQIAIEHDGKEPSPRQLTSLIDIARSHNITKLLIQPQYNKEKLQSLASECDADIVEVDPLSEDIIAEIERVTRIICSK